MDHLKSIKKLKNRYFVMRHGQAESNEKGIIVGDPKIGTKRFGLTEKGIHEVKDSVSKSGLDKNTIIYSSDFLRTKQTAELASKLLGSKELIFTEKLRERAFGKFEGCGSEEYEQVWEEDRNHESNSVEPVEKIIDRMTSLISEIEGKYKNKTILLVSHGDPILMLITCFLGLEMFDYMKIDHIKTADIRELKRK